MNVIFSRSQKSDSVMESDKFFENKINEFLTIGELATRLKLSVSGLRKIIARDNKFPKYKVGHQLRFHWKAVECYFRKGE